MKKAEEKEIKQITEDIVKMVQDEFRNFSQGQVGERMYALKQLENQIVGKLTNGVNGIIQVINESEGDEE